VTSLGSMEGLFLETTLMGPFALGYLVFAGLAGFGAFATISAGTDVLPIAGGAITAFPLICFASGARRITYIAVGFFQYIAPTGHFFLAVFAFGESFTMAHLVTFGCIWTGLAIFSADSWRRAMRSRRARAAAAE
jgi:chloramphenicol-sensitive protein RarD